VRYNVAKAEGRTYEKGNAMHNAASQYKAVLPNKGNDIDWCGFVGLI